MKKTEPRNHLPETFWTLRPDLARVTLTQDQLRETLLYHEGRISAHGQLWDIVSRHLGAGVFEVRLKAAEL